MQNTTIAQPGHAASSARSSQCNAVIFSAGRRPSVGNFWSYSELLKLLKPDPMLITRSVKCLSIPHKIRKRIEYTRQRHAKCQKMFECAINKHRIVLIPSELWDLCKGKGDHFTRVWSAEARASLLLPPGMWWAVSTINLLATLMDQDPGHGGVMVKYDTLPGHFIHCGHHISVFGFNNDSILSLYTFRNSHSTIYLIVHRLHATDGVYLEEFD